MSVVDERTLCARLKSWIDAELQLTPYGTLTRAENEVHATGTNTRHDLLIFAGNKPVFSCEVKVPTNPQGTSPYDHSVVENARRKAEVEGLSFFGTFNCASFVLWQVDMPGIPIYRRGIDRWRVVEPQHLTRLDGSDAENTFKDFVRPLPTAVARVGFLAFVFFRAVCFQVVSRVLAMRTLYALLQRQGRFPCAYVRASQVNRYCSWLRCSSRRASEFRSLRASTTTHASASSPRWLLVRRPGRSATHSSKLSTPTGSPSRS